MVNKAVPLNDVMAQTLELAEKIAENDPFSLRMIKKGLRMAQCEVSLEALMEFEIEACLACVSTKTRKAALDQFEKRKS